MSSKQKKKRIKAVHQKLRVFRAKEPLLDIIMWGINHSINELNFVSLPVMLMPDDFKAFSKIRIDNHLFNKENMPSHFKFKEWCPLVFRNLRERFDVDEDDYLHSLTKHCPMEIDSPGKSGARFLISHNRKFILKTVPSEDVSEVLRILKDYHQYIVEHHGETRLPQMLGMYKVTINDADTHVLVMKNIFTGGLKIHKKYDLKGSKVDRHASDKEKAKKLPTFKDNDFLSDQASINIDRDEKIKFMKVLEADSTFLASLNLMDYSLLVGIHEINHPSNFEDFDEEEEEEGLDEEDGDGLENNDGDDALIKRQQSKDEQQRNDNDSKQQELIGKQQHTHAGKPRRQSSLGQQQQSSSLFTPPSSPRARAESEGDCVCNHIACNEESLGYYAIKSNDKSAQPVIYFMSLIDILTRYGVKKKTAKAAKTMKHGSGAEISTVKPEQYARRFMEFIDRIIVAN